MLRLLAGTPGSGFHDGCNDIETSVSESAREKALLVDAKSVPELLDF